MRGVIHNNYKFNKYFVHSGEELEITNYFFKNSSNFTESTTSILSASNLDSSCTAHSRNEKINQKGNTMIKTFMTSQTPTAMKAD
ncbi:hypothetical protein A9970_17975 [Sphingobacterium sp. UME9]|nr:hypothetical protein [Sphingobacterium sp. UME9]